MAEIVGVDYRHVVYLRAQGPLIEVERIAIDRVVRIDQRDVGGGVGREAARQVSAVSPVVIGEQRIVHRLHHLFRVRRLLGSHQILPHDLLRSHRSEHTNGRQLSLPAGSRRDSEHTAFPLV